MANSLIIVESPAKAKTLGKFLGREYEIRASMGHVRDLPKSKLGIDVDHGFAPEYVTIPGKEATIKDLKAAARKASTILLASDPDREGEAIAWHLASVLQLAEPRRIELHEITPNAVERALKEPRPMNQDLVDAQQARRVIDRLVGYKLSPMLWKKVRKGLSAGRVQSVAVRLVCEREAEIDRFQPVESWTLDAMLSKHGQSRIFPARLYGLRAGGEKLEVKDEPQARTIMAQLEGATYQVLSVETKDSVRNSLPPYRTSTLQQDASTRLRMKPGRTMRVAQDLYEGVDLGAQGPVGLITYMRTDSFRISDEAASAARGFIQEQYGPTYVRREKPDWKAKGSVQDAHEAIRPTDVQRTPDSVKNFLAPDQLRLYRLIWQRFLASQMSAARFAQTRADIGAGDYVFRASGSVLVFDGFYAVWERDQDNDEEKELPPLTAEELLALHELKPEQHFTQPPPRYSEASLIKALEELGIGRPSTYAPTVDVIQARHYVQQIERRLRPTELGKTVNAWLIEHFPDIVDVSFTAEMEEELDDVEEGRREWVPIVREFYRPFEQTLAKAESSEKVRVPLRETGEDCPKCKQEGRTGRLVYRMSRIGEFVGCNLWPECDYIQGKDGQDKSAAPTPTGEMCPTCGKPLVNRTGRRGPFVACSGYPKCKYVKREIQPADVVEGRVCPKCGKTLLNRTGRFGKFVGCSGYPECRYLEPGAKTAVAPPDPSTFLKDDPCPRCGKPQVMRQGRYGDFKSCSDYPNCKPERKGRAAGASTPRPRRTRKPPLPAA
ncbi:MAG TPA: type I DNA topoisomerase [Candidatus Limnocylindrales bacterium]|nr:type I DNA topoisomerase [Candidatus Limnocylindrales bacterium]